MDRYEIINEMAEVFGYTNYLEIGVATRCTFERVSIPHKTGVDPNVEAEYIRKMTSDEFFGDNKDKYDLIFIDGNHVCEQVVTDIYNSLNVLNDNGSIVMHDCNPIYEEAQVKPPVWQMWNGDVWKAFMMFRCTRPDLSMLTVDADCGCGIIRFGNQRTYSPVVEDNMDMFTWEYFRKHRNEILNLISVDEFHAHVAQLVERLNGE